MCHLVYMGHQNMILSCLTNISLFALYKFNPGSQLPFHFVGEEWQFQFYWGYFSLLQILGGFHDYKEMEIKVTMITTDFSLNPSDLCFQISNRAGIFAEAGDLEAQSLAS